MILSTPAHKQTDPAKAPGQIVNRMDISRLGMFGALYGTNNPRVFSDGYSRGVSAEEKSIVAAIGTSNAHLLNDGAELEGATCD